MDNYEKVYFCFCNDNCKFETMTKEQIIAAIAEATGNTPTEIDAAFITKIKEQNKGNSLIFWLGTTAEYNAIETKDPNCFYIKTDDTTIEDITTAITTIIDEIEEIKKNIPSFKRLLTAEDDLNDIKESGVYFYSSTSVPANCPYSNAGIVEVVGTGHENTRKIQRVTRYGEAGYTTQRILDQNADWLEWTAVPLMLKKTYTIATNDNGNANTSIDPEKYIILNISAKDSSGSENYLCNLYKSIANNGRWYVNICNVTSKTNIANTEFTLTIYYAAI